MAPFSVLAAAANVQAAAALPTSERGSILPYRETGQTGAIVPGWSVFEAQSRTVPVPELRWPRSVQTYEDMTRDPQIQGLLMSVWLPIRHMQWYLEPNGAPATLVQEIAEDFGLPVGTDPTPEDGPGLDHDEHLRLALLALAGGHKFFEESGDIVGNGTDAKYRLRRLTERPNETLSRIDINSAGDLLSIRVPSADPAVDGPFVDLPAEHLLSYVWDRRGADWAGRPLLYGLYRAWLLKDELVRGAATMMRRFGGIPYMETTSPDVGEKAHLEAAAYMQALRSGDTSGFSAPYGMKPHLMGVEGTLPDPMKQIIYHDSQMARAFMQMFAELGQNGKGGSRALGTTLVDHYALGVLAVAKWIRKSQMHLVRRIAERNYGYGVQLPLIRCRQDDQEDITVTDLVALIDSGAIVVDDDLEAQIRQRSNLVPRNPAEPGRVPPSKAVPVAASRRRRPIAAATTPSDPAAASSTDFADLQATHEQALTDLSAAWAPVRASQVDALVAQVAAATSVAELAAITAPAVTGAVLLSTLIGLVEHGADTVKTAAEAQGVTVTAPDLTAATLTVGAASDAAAVLMSNDLARSAASVAVGQWGTDPDPAKIADTVRQHLEDLAGTAEDYELAGVASQAQNEGRFAAFEQDGHEGDLYASAVNDTHSCEPCLQEDDTNFPSMAEARRDFPVGGFIGCKGGKRCRCTVVKVYAETPGQAA